MWKPFALSLVVELLLIIRDRSKGEKLDMDYCRIRLLWWLRW